MTNKTNQSKPQTQVTPASWGVLICFHGWQGKASKLDATNKYASSSRPLRRFSVQYLKQIVKYMLNRTSCQCRVCVSFVAVLLIVSLCCAVFRPDGGKAFMGVILIRFAWSTEGACMLHDMRLTARNMHYGVQLAPFVTLVDALFNGHLRWNMQIGENMNRGFIVARCR